METTSARESLFSDLTGQENFQPEDETILKLVEPARTFDPGEYGSTVHAFFESQPMAEGVVIAQGETPLGLVMRNEFYQQLGGLYGRDLFLRRPIKLLMTPNPLVVDVSVDIATIGLIAMNREQGHLYDMVIVTENAAFLGVVSIKRFMIELSKNKEKEILLLKKQQDLLRMANEAEVTHRHQIEEKNNALREKNDAIKNLFDNAGQGFLSFDADMTISEEYSLECVHIFRGPIGGKHFAEVLGKHVAPETAQTLPSVFASVFAATKPVKEKVYLSLLPTEVMIHDKIVLVDYKIIRHLDQKRVMVVLTDVTEKKRLERKMVEERQNLKMVVKSLANQADVNGGMARFRDFVAEEARAMVEGASEPAVALAEIFRQIHTFKGDFAQFGLHNTAQNLHEIESGLAAMTSRGTPPERDELRRLLDGWDAEAILQADSEILVANLGRSFFATDETFSVSKKTILDMEERVVALLSGPEREDILNLLRSLRLHNVKNLLLPYRDYLLSLAQRLEKGIEPLVVVGDEVLIEKERYQPFFKSLVHVFRNMIDHGIESMEDRLESGKYELGRIKCSVKHQPDGGFSVSVSDDGRGIDTARVLAKALEKGIVTRERVSAMSSEEVYDLLFLDAFSTKDDVTTLSGRGVGLAAVKAEVERLGGSIVIKSEPGQGTKFRFVLPALGA